MCIYFSLSLSLYIYIYRERERYAYMYIAAAAGPRALGRQGAGAPDQHLGEGVSRA